jgi:hypothetical protein
MRSHLFSLSLLSFLFSYLLFAPKTLSEEPQDCIFVNQANADLQVDDNNPVEFIAEGDSAARYVIDCAEARKLIITPAVQVEGKEFTPVSTILKVLNLANGLEIKSGDTIGTDPITISISLRIKKGSRFEPGNYKFKVNLSLVKE